MTAVSGMATFGQILRENRRSRGLSQAQLGGRRYSGSYISHLESGRRTANREVIEFLAGQLGVAPEELGASASAAATPDHSPQAAEALAQLLVAERAWHDREWGTASELAAKAASSALELGLPIRFWQARFLQAQADAADGRFDQAAEIALSLADDPVAAQSKTLRAEALSLASTSFRASDQLAMAITCAAQAVELSADAPPIVLADSLKSLVSAMLEAGRSDAKVEQFCRRLADVALHVESEHAKGAILWTLGTAAYKAGDPDRGRGLHDEALSLISPQRDLRMWVRLRRVVATCRMDAGDTDGVSDLLETARVGTAFVGNAYDRFELRHAEAKFAVLQGRLTEAVEILHATLADGSLAPAVTTNGRVEELLGDTLRDLGEVDAARAAYERAASVYEAQTQFRLANACWQRALELQRTAATSPCPRAGQYLTELSNS